MRFRHPGGFPRFDTRPKSRPLGASGRCTRSVKFGLACGLQLTAIIRTLTAIIRTLTAIIRTLTAIIRILTAIIRTLTVGFRTLTAITLTLACRAKARQRRAAQQHGSGVRHCRRATLPLSCNTQMMRRSLGTFRMP